MDMQPHLTAEQLRSGLVQILKTYSRAGLNQFNTSSGCQFSAEVQQQLAQWLSSAVSLEPSKSSASTTSYVSSALDRASSFSGSDNRHQFDVVPASAHSPSSMAASPGATSKLTSELLPTAPLGRWQLPALELAERQNRLAELDLQVRGCRKCEELVCYRRQTVFGEGHLQPRVCFYGEAPGADEDAQGRPFVGAAGKLLSDIIRAMRLSREEVYILNSLKCRPPQNRTPLPEEVENCRPYALAQLEILQPEFIVLLGAVAVRSVLQSTEPVGRLRGRFHHFHGAKVLVTYHPAYLLRNVEAKKLVWADVQLVMRALAQNSPA